ncbi:MAG: transposase [Thermodesulfobacteriota bacterium]|nr:transposase [Thermodesulfobacteriota bacterium]
MPKTTIIQSHHRVDPLGTLDTEEGRRIYSKRLGIVEPFFGNIRKCKMMDRFTLRGRVTVNIQWLLYCLVYNIEKLINYGKSYVVATV